MILKTKLANMFYTHASLDSFVVFWSRLSLRLAALAGMAGVVDGLLDPLRSTVRNETQSVM